MRDFFSKLLGLVIAWGALFFFWDNRLSVIPVARAWINNPLIQLQTTIDRKLTPEERLLMSYYLPKIYPISYVCGEYNAGSDLVRSFLPGDTYRNNEKEGKSLRCGSGLNLINNGDFELDLVRAKINPALELKKGGVIWATNSEFSLVLSYLTAEVKSAAPVSKGAFIQSIDRVTLIANTPTILNFRRAALPNYSSMPLFLQADTPTISVNDDLAQFEMKGLERAMLTAVSIRHFAEVKKQ
jgi:hypothetical protein